MPRSMSATSLGHVTESEIPVSGYQFKKRFPRQESTALAGSPNTDSIQDLICIGLGPASLAIAIALQDAAPSLSRQPNLSFLERQPKFAWHSGMQIPGARMQISFLKDLATPRNPKSKFTFINYLFSKGRLNTFINLDTFLPSRKEYEDYLRWCASHFEALGQVSYNQEVLSVTPAARSSTGKVTSFQVLSRNSLTGGTTSRHARHVVIAVGGKPLLPKELPPFSPLVIHSSQYSNRFSSALPNPNAAYNIAVIGNGQSAAEIFNDLPNRFPNAKITLLIKGSALRPSDDSPFVNEVFDPERVDNVYAQNAELRRQAIVQDRATNYGVVRLGLLEHLYERLYAQRVANEDPSTWQVQIRSNRQVVSAVEEGQGKKLRLCIEKVVDDGVTRSNEWEELVVDAVFVATGYVRNAHEDMMAETRDLLPPGFQSLQSKIPVGRDYRVLFDAEKVDTTHAGIWLQGCNESTHGLSDTLLSILAVRGGELVQSIFGVDVGAESSVRAKL